MGETSTHESSKTIQGALRRTVAFWGQRCLGSLHLQRGRMDHSLIDGACMPYFEKHLSILANGSFGPISQLIDEVQHGREQESSTHRLTIGRGLVSEGLNF